LLRRCVDAAEQAHTFLRRVDQLLFDSGGMAENMIDFLNLQQNATTAMSQGANESPAGFDLTVSFIAQLLTLALVLATVWLGWQTRAVAKETLKARLADYEPIIKSTLGWIGPIGVSLKIQNVGRGVAKNIEIEIEQLPEKSAPRKWVQPLLAPNEFARLPLEPIYFKDLVSTFERIKIKGHCVDALGRTHPIDDVIDLKEIQKSVENAPQLLETTIEEQMGEIGNKLDEFKRHIENVLRQMQEGVVVKTAAEAEKERKEKLREFVERSKGQKKEEAGK